MFSHMMSSITGKEKASALNTPSPISGQRNVPKTPAKAPVKSASSTPAYQLSEAERREQMEKVRRLKAEREKEREKKLLAQKAKAPPKASNRSGVRTGGNSVARSRAPASAPARNTYVEPPRRAEPPKKKLNFKDIMSHAEKIDTEKMKVTIKVRDKLKEAPSKSRSDGDPTANNIRSTGRKEAPKEVSYDDMKKSKPEAKPAHVNKLGAHIRSQGDRPSSAKAQRGLTEKPSSKSSSFAQPMPHLAEKYRKRKEMELKKQQKYYEDQHELDDFIVDDEEEEEDLQRDQASNYHDEIWSIFNRGKKRPVYYDDDSDSDMEARGSEIMAEELRSSRAARKEDEEEERRLQQLADAKRKRRLQH